MTKLLALIGVVCLFGSDQAMTVAAKANANADADNGSWTQRFDVQKGEWTSRGRNPYFSIEPGDQLVLKSGDDTLVITVLHETKVVDGVQTRVIEERESSGSKLVEVSRNYFAMSKRTNSVYYFGEDVDVYKNGKVDSHEGSWLAGINGAKFGLMMPGQVLVRGRYYQEVSPGQAMDRAEIVSMGAMVKTTAGEFQNCVKIEETSPLEPGAREYKYYASGVGLVQEESLTLARHHEAK